MEKEHLINLINEIKKGNKSAFEELFRAYYGRLCDFAFEYLKQRQNAQDAVSVFFVNLWNRREQMPEITSPEAYLFVSVKNASINFMRRQEKRETTSLDNASQLKASAASIEHKELASALRDIIDNLPEQQRIIFRLVKENGLRCRQIATILNISERTAENQLYRAVNTVADKISEILGYNPKTRRGKSTQMFLKLFV